MRKLPQFSVDQPKASLQYSHNISSPSADLPISLQKITLIRAASLHISQLFIFHFLPPSWAVKKYKYEFLYIYIHTYICIGTSLPHWSDRKEALWLLSSNWEYWIFAFHKLFKGQKLEQITGTLKVWIRITASVTHFSHITVFKRITLLWWSESEFSGCQVIIVKKKL